jgi:hypothetical protein
MAKAWCLLILVEASVPPVLTSACTYIVLLLAATNQLLVSRVAELEADLRRANSRGGEEVAAVEPTTEAGA